VSGTSPLGARKTWVAVWYFDESLLLVVEETPGSFTGESKGHPKAN
jgi:hypothetical protein